MPAFGAIVSAAVLYQTIREKPNRPKNKKHSRTQRTKNEGKNAKENPFHFMHNTWMHWEEQVYKCKHAIRDADFGDISYNIIHKESQRKRNSHHSVMLITMGKLPGKFIHFALLFGSRFIISDYSRIFVCRTDNITYWAREKKWRIKPYEMQSHTHNNRSPWIMIWK